MNKEGYPNCFTASIKNRWHHCHYPVQNSLQSNDCKGVHLCFRPDSTAPKLVKNVSLLHGSWKSRSIGKKCFFITWKLEKSQYWSKGLDKFTVKEF